MMKITPSGPYQSITEFQEIEIPDITIIYGPNGSGKSHLLMALAEGIFTATDGERDLSTAYASNFHDIDPLQYTSPSKNEQHAKLHREVIDYISVSPAIDKFIQENTTEAQKWAIGSDRIGLLDIASKNLDSLDPKVKQLDLDLIAEMRAKKPHLVSYMERFLDFTGFRPHEIQVDDFATTYQQTISSELLRPQLGQLFNRYIEKIRSDLKLKIRQNPEYTSYDEFLTSFYKKYGHPPWEFYNNQLRNFGLDFNFFVPTSLPPYNWTVSLRKGEQPISAEFMSSGEKVLFSFVLATLIKKDKSMKIYKPDLLLLDEPDAHLHPALVQDLFHQVIFPLVADDTKVIITTHSPTTVAFAPDQSIYQKITGKDIIRTTKQKAINNLLLGVPHLALDFSGRRQVFTESIIDEHLYQEIYTICQSQIESNRSLSFIGTGASKNGGKENVKAITRNLRRSGSNSVFGIIDWDGTEKETSFIFVSGQDLFYSIENILLNPLLLGLLLIFEKNIDSLREYKFIEAASYNNDRLEEIVRAVESKLPAPNPSQRTLIQLAGGKSIRICSDLLTMNGHDYEQAVEASYPNLRSWAKTPDKCLKRAIVHLVLKEFPEYCPRCFIDIFQRMLLAE